MIEKWREISALDEMIIAVFGFSPKVLGWFDGYLRNRSQRMRVKGCVSNCIQNELGVPQGSVLGALLFILNINDLPSELKDAFVNLFADDTLITSMEATSMY